MKKIKEKKVKDTTTVVIELNTKMYKRYIEKKHPGKKSGYVLKETIQPMLNKWLEKESE